MNLRELAKIKSFSKNDADKYGIPVKELINKKVMNLRDLLEIENGGKIHFYALVSKEGEHRDRIEKLGGEIIDERVVRSYSPAQWHAVYDIKKKE